jgi:5-methylcytosine-specific restriction endonuclease McrA
MSHVFVVDAAKRPLSPCHPARARRLLTAGTAAVFRRYPFTIILQRAVPAAQPDPLRLKIDPGSKTSGLAIVHERSDAVVWAAELSHRGQQVRARLVGRRAIRRSRRQRHTRYRPARFANRRRPTGWLPPSLQSRIQNIQNIQNIQTWVNRRRRLCPVGALSQELVRFDTQLLQHAAIAGVEYQQGELAGYEVREYPLEKWGRACAYCGAEGVPLEVERLVPRIGGAPIG